MSNVFELLLNEMKNSIDIASVSPIKTPSEATIKVPGSKSYSIRALVISYLCKEDVEIDNLLESDDTKAMQNCLAALKDKKVNIDAKESGLSARFMIALACISKDTQIISGQSSLLKRPVKGLVEALRQLGAEIEYVGTEGFLPVKIISSELKQGSVRLNSRISSQYLSALLLIAPALKTGLVIEIDGEQISKPYINMTIDIMDHFGIKVENQNLRRYVIKPQKYQPKRYVVEGDFSSASYFFAAAALTNSKASIGKLNPQSKQADRKFLDVLSGFGAKVDITDGKISVTGGGLKPIHANMSDCPDQAMTAAVLAAFASGESVIKGVKSLRVKETERVAAIENELAKMGIETSSTEDSLTINGGNPRSADIDTYGDHRIAMSLAIAALKIPNINIMKPEVVNKTFPGFWDELKKITEIKFHKRQFSNVLFIGMRGSGKTSVGRILAERLGKKFVDMDIYLEKKHGQKVRDIVLENGWEYFRKLESEACEEISSQKNIVISSGGGIVIDQKNMEMFKNDSVNILLKAEPALLSARIRTDRNRPELSTQPTLLGELAEVWKKRKELYYSSADFIIDTSKNTPQAIADEIIRKLN